MKIDRDVANVLHLTCCTVWPTKTWVSREQADGSWLFYAQTFRRIGRGVETLRVDVEARDNPEDATHPLLEVRCERQYDDMLGRVHSRQEAVCTEALDLQTALRSVLDDIDHANRTLVEHRLLTDEVSSEVPLRLGIPRQK